MTDVDEALLTAAKLQAQASGDLESNVPLLEGTGLVDGDDLGSIAFVEQALGEPFGETAIGKEIMPTLIAKRANKALEEGNAAVLSHLVGVTEQDLDASALTLPMKLLDEMNNNGAPCFMSAVGNPNTGKTNSVMKLFELRKVDRDDLLIVSNVRTWDESDIHVTSAHDLAVALLENRDVPKAVLIDEGSTHFDARTYRQQIAQQYTPMAKRYAKIGVDVEAVVGHTGKDLHPERKRLTTLAIVKQEKTSAEFFDRWQADADAPTDPIFDGSLESFEKAEGYNPDDAAPWSWDLEPELFTLDLSWSELLDELVDRGPARD